MHVQSELKKLLVKEMSLATQKETNNSTIKDYWKDIRVEWDSKKRIQQERGAV
jgi:hypothetical protein